MMNKLIAVCAVAAIAATGSAHALTNKARRAIPGASTGRHYVQHQGHHHATRQGARAKPVIPPQP